MNALIEKLRGTGIFLTLSEGKLKINAPAGVVTPEILGEIKENREGLISYINGVMNKRRQESIPHAAKQAFYKLSAAQKRMYFLYELDKSSIAYNMPQVIKMPKGGPDLDRLQAVLDELLSRHESLRTIFTVSDEEPRQQILQVLKINIEQFAAETESEKQDILKNFVRPFDLDKGPLVRVAVLRILEDDWFLLLDMHHIISDGVSNGILAEEFKQIYFGGMLSPAPSLQYKDYAEWQYSPEMQQAVQEHGAYWRNLLGNNLPVLKLPADFQRVARSDVNGGLVEYYLTEVQYRLLEQHCNKYNVTLSMMMYCIFGMLLSKLSGQEDLVLGLSTASRNHPDLEGVVGLFVNSLPIRIFANRRQRFEEYLGNVRDVVLEAYHHQHFHFDVLVNQLATRREEGRNPIFDVMLNMEGKVQERLDMNDHPAGVYSHLQSSRRFDLTLNVTEYENTALLQLQYDASLFLPETATSVLRYFNNLIGDLGSFSGLTLSDIDIESPKVIEEVRQELTAGHVSAPGPGELIPASYHQERLWFIDSFEAGYLYPESPVYHNIPLILEMKGQLNMELLEKSIQSVVDKYDILRTSVVTQAETPFQTIRPDLKVSLTREILDNNDSIKKWMNEFINRPFTLTDALVRAAIAITDQQSYRLLMVFHHIIADGYSVVQLKDEILSNYQLFLDGRDIDLLSFSVPFHHFSGWQKNALKTLDPHLLSYWRQQLGGKLLPVELPLDRPRAEVHTYTAGMVRLAFIQQLADHISRYERAYDIPRELILMGAFKILLQKYAQQEEIIIGTSFSNRAAAGSQLLIGPVANLIPLRSFISSDKSFREFLHELAATYSNGIKYGEMPFDKLVKELAPEKDMSRTALFDILFQFEDRQHEPQVEGLAISTIETNLGYGKYDLNLAVYQSGEGLEGAMVYNKDYLDEETVASLLAHYTVLLQNLLDQPDRSISGISLLSELDEEKALTALDDREVPYPRDLTITDLFCRRVKRSPGTVAVKFLDQELTYEELDRRSTAVAVMLSRYVRSNEVVALLVDRSIETIIGMIGILKAGGAYLPIDVDYPEERIDYLIKDSGTSVVLTMQQWADRITRPEDLTVLNIEDAGSVPDAGFIYRGNPEDLSYVIYTSGTTGNPKGVMIEHRNVVRLLFNDRFQFNFSEADVWTMFHSHCFDFSVWEMYGALLFGGKLVIIPKKVSADTSAFLTVLKEEAVTVLNQTPGAFYNLIEEEMRHTDNALQLRYIIFGGEALTTGKLEPWHNKYPQTKLVNMYGITETTVHVTYKEIGLPEIRRNISNVGKPIPTLSVYIFDKDQHLVPRGVSGELYVGGEGLSRGYLGKPELTESKFVRNPYRPGERLYRSGDLARILPNGELEYLGRSDEQVKIRGFRIELGEIAFQLTQYPSIKGATVVTVVRKGDKYLGAYYVSDQPIAVNDLRAFLYTKLPDYMVPAYFMRIDRIPLTSNGKVDRKALPELVDQDDTYYECAGDEAEQALVEIWASVLSLKKEDISVTKSFFELGGHSLKAAVLINRINKDLHTKLALRDVFKYQTIREQAGLIRAADRVSYTLIPKAAEKERYGLSSAQRRLYFLYEMDKASLAYNMPRFIKIKGTVDIKKLQEAFSALIQVHESLRTVFRMHNGMPCQELLETGRLQLGLIFEPDLQRAAGEFVRPFDLASGPLFRAALISADETNHILAIDIHHIISDGVSNSVLIDDFMMRYSGVPLPVPVLQYKDYAEWQQSRDYQLLTERQKSYWLDIYKEELSALELPYDFNRPKNKTYEGDHLYFQLDESATRQLRDLAAREGITLYMALLAVYSILLGKLGDTEDVVIGTPVAGRESADIERVVGLFTNTIPLRNYPDGNKTFKAYLKEVKQGALQSFENQSYQYEDLINELKVERDPGRNPLFDVLFSYNNMGERTFALGDVETENYDPDQRIAKFDLTLTVNEEPSSLQLEFDFNTSLFEKNTIGRFAGYFQKIVDTITKEPDVSLSDINILDSKEEETEIFGHNKTDAYFPADKTLIQLFEEQVRRTPDHIALRCEDRALTFAEFSVATDKMASFLVSEADVRPGDLVGVLLEREEYLLTSIYGILKACAAYVPIDPYSPPDRINAIIENSGIKALITRGRYYNDGIQMNGKVIDLDESGLSIKARPAANSSWKQQQSDMLAYVIYTSGSTGNPKGVMISHRSVINRLHWMQGQYPLTKDDIILQKTPVVFDVSVWELFGWTISGSSLCLLQPGAEKDPEELALTIARHKITAIHFVPSMLQTFLFHIGNRVADNSLASLSMVFASGEALRAEQVAEFGKQLHARWKTRLINLYGPTEATVEVSHYEINFEEQPAQIPIGRPIDNIRLYVLDKHGSPVPQGVKGQLFIAGVGLAKGYLGNESLTKEQFVPDPWHSGALMYKTGDVVRRNKKGEIEYIGRNDFQVKLRGFRIDSGDIESNLLRYGPIKDCAVLLKERNGEKFLVAYYVSSEVEEEGRLRQYLAEKLPAYMVPSVFIALPALPLTTSGKLNRKALPEPGFSLSAELVRPVNQVQKDLVIIWADILGCGTDEISVNANFFSIGGNSLSLIRLTSRINQHFNANISVADVFRYPVIASIAEFLSNATSSQEDVSYDIDQSIEIMSEALELINYN